MTYAIRIPVLVVAVSFCLAGCGVGQPGDSEDTPGTTADELRRNNPCALVRCASGTHCVARGKQASCVADVKSCSSNADCRTFDNYCGGCSCQALTSTAPNPVCTGTTVNCFVAPCMNKTAVCSSGVCVLN